MTQQQPDLDAVAKAILDANHYMTLGTADAAGRPWVSPVFFARALAVPSLPGHRHLALGPRPERRSRPADPGQPVTAPSAAMDVDALAAEIDDRVRALPAPSTGAIRRVRRDYSRRLRPCPPSRSWRWPWR